MGTHIYSSPVRRIFVLLVLSMFLSGCTTSRTFQTGGRAGDGLVAGPLQVVLDPYWPSTVDVSQDVVQRPFGSNDRSFVISPKQRQEALQSSRLLRELIRSESQTSLPSRLAKIGFRSANPGEKTRNLKLYIPSIQMRCSVYGNCFTVARVRLDLETPENTKSSWFYLGEFGQPATGGEINANLFTSFIDSLLVAMEKDGLLPTRGAKGQVLN